MSKHLEKLKDIELFEGKTLDEIFQVIYDMSIEQQKEAMSAFKKLNEFVQDTEDAFMLGDKGAPYLDNAHKATDNLIKMVTASHKLINKEEEAENQNISSADILSVLDSQGIAPSRFVDNDDDEVVEDSKIDDNVFPTLKKKSQQ
tara:strand:- start:1234 stop:1668 length:435 start_codon:yes stop_codon:yes gene_type:complete